MLSSGMSSLRQLIVVCWRFESERMAKDELVGRQYGEGLHILLGNLPEWQPVEQFLDRLNAYFRGPRTFAEIADYREAKGPLKKLSSEVVPIARHLKFMAFAGAVRFSMSDKFPDAWLQDLNGREQGIEVTVAQAREKYELAAELNRKGIGRGFLGLADTASRSEFEHRLARPRVMYTSQNALAAIGNGIIQCIKKKNKVKYAGYDLLIEAPLSSLSPHHWEQVVGELRHAAEQSFFRQIHVIGNGEEKLYGFQLK